MQPFSVAVLRCSAPPRQRHMPAQGIDAACEIEVQVELVKRAKAAGRTRAGNVLIAVEALFVPIRHLSRAKARGVVQSNAHTEIPPQIRSVISSVSAASESVFRRY